MRSPKPLRIPERDVSAALSIFRREPFRQILRQNRYGITLFLCAALLTASRAEAGKAGSSDPYLLGRTAAESLAQGNLAAAAQTAQQALRILPDDGSLQILAGAILLQTGNYAPAGAAFENVRKDRPDDALAQYGSGLSRLAQGDWRDALRKFAQSGRNDGSHDALRLAQAYAQSFETKENNENEDENRKSVSERALSGMMLAKRGATGQAIAALEAAASAMPANFMAPPAGLRMSFDAARPFAARRNPAVVSLLAQPVASAALYGDAQLAPQNPAPEVAYVSYEMDAQSVGLVNVAPFAFTWNTRHVPNGSHTLQIRCYDRDGLEISATSRTLRVYNRDANKTNRTESADETALRTALWQALTPVPDRSECAFTLGKLYRARGRHADAERWLWQAAAERDGSRTGAAKRELTELGVRNATEDSFYCGPTDRKEIALTFDDGPKPELTDALLDLLVREKVPATFFVIGRNAEANPDLTRRIAQAGMELANHSYTHRNLARLSPEEIALEMTQTQATLFALTGKRPRYMRPPGGAWSAKVNRTARAAGLIPCFWTADVFGSEVVSSQQAANAVIAKARPGAIILMHNGKLSTLQALPTILRELRAKGYTFVTATTLGQRWREKKPTEYREAQSREAARLRRAE